MKAENVVDGTQVSVERQEQEGAAGGTRGACDRRFRCNSLNQCHPEGAGDVRETPRQLPRVTVVKLSALMDHQKAEIRQSLVEKQRKGFGTQTRHKAGCKGLEWEGRG